jgi:hypothetical protein
VEAVCGAQQQVQRRVDGAVLCGQGLAQRVGTTAAGLGLFLQRAAAHQPAEREGGRTTGRVVAEEGRAQGAGMSAEGWMDAISRWRRGTRAPAKPATGMALAQQQRHAHGQQGLPACGLPEVASVLAEVLDVCRWDGGWVPPRLLQDGSSVGLYNGSICSRGGREERRGGSTREQERAAQLEQLEGTFGSSLAEEASGEGHHPAQRAKKH